LEALTGWAVDVLVADGSGPLELLHQVDAPASCRAACKSRYDLGTVLPAAPPSFPREVICTYGTGIPEITGYGCSCRGGLGAFDEVAVLEAGSGADQGNEVGRGDRAPAGLGGLGELEHHRACGAPIYVILDNLSAHKGKQTWHWAKRP
jgi:hypothetical protein